MRTALTAAALVVVIGHLWLVVTSLKSRSVLAGFLGAMGIAIVLLAIVAGATRDYGQAVLAGAAIMLETGVALYRLGQLMERLLNREPDDRCEEVLDRAGPDPPRGADRYERFSLRVRPREPA